jgi:hypothetical protein
LHAHIARYASIQAGRQEILLLNQDLPHTAHLPVRSWPNLFAGKEQFIVQFPFFLVQHLLYLLPGVSTYARNLATLSALSNGLFAYTAQATMVRGST